jgi:hypothetical protein
MTYQRKRCDPGECGRLDYESRIKELSKALEEMLAAFSMTGALNVGGMQRRTDAKKHAREALKDWRS